MKVPAVTRNELRTYECKSWDEFVSLVRREWPLPEGTDAFITADEVIFRGHSDPEWKLWSKMERSLVGYAVDSEGKKHTYAARKTKGLSWYDTYCAEVLDKFRRLSHGMTGFYPNMPDDELWALGRHHGLLTPLLDWTESPYVATYFALEDYRREWERGSKIRSVSPEGVVCVWGLRFWDKLEKHGEFEVVRAIPTTAARQRAQRGLFTRLRSEDHQDVLGYLTSRNLAHCLEVYRIPGSAVIDALRDLELMNLTPATLFPDLSGAAEQANFDMAALRFAAFDVQFPAWLVRETADT